MSTVTQTCPSLEDIAAFLDGKLSEGERTRIIAHLADCPSCYAVFAGAARFQLAEEQESEEPAKPPNVIPFPRRAPWALPLAALLILGLATIPLYLRYSMPRMDSAELVNPTALAQVPSSSLWSKDRRGEERGTNLDSTPFELLVGAHLVDLRLTLTRNDRGKSGDVLSRINRDLQQIPVEEEQRELYLKAQAEIDAGRRSPGDLTGEALRMEAELTELLVSRESPYLALGKWAEAGRLSALARDPAFFEDRENRRFPGWLLRNTLPEDVLRNLQRIRDILDNSEPAKLPYDALKGHFEAILQHYQTEADLASDSR